MATRFLKAVLFLCVVVGSLGLDNGLALTPQMAWNSWNALGCNINETSIMAMANAVIDTGLSKLGYNYVNMDDCWARSRNASGFIEPDPVAFPHGIKYVADYVHSLGLKFGLYSDAGNFTCGGRPGSLGYEKQDAEQYAAWGVDYLKYDNCNNDNIPDIDRYTAMRKALNATGRSIFFSLCDWAVTTAPWGTYTGNSWRTTVDIQAYWESWTNNLDENNIDAPYAGPGGWNDPDMLEVGNGELTPDENVAHFSLWALVKAPLIIGTDLRKIVPQVLEVITNDEVIAVSQDPLGRQGVRLTYNMAENNTLFGNLLYADACDGSPAQIFTYYNGSFVNQLSGMCTGQATPYWACGNTASWGGTLYSQECGKMCGGRQQQFSIKGNTITTNYHSGEDLCLTTVPKANSTQSDVILWNCTGSSNQEWTQNSDGTITNGQSCLTLSGGQEVWGTELSDASYAVILFNRAQASQTVTVYWTDLGFFGAAGVRDLWKHADMGVFKNSYSAEVNSHGVVFVRVYPIH